MRVALLAPEFVPTLGGVGIYSYNLAKELCRYSDMELHVFTPGRGHNYNKEEILKHFDNKIYIHNLSSANDSFFYNAKFQLALFSRFSGFHNTYNFDLIHSANLVNMPDIFLKLTQIPTVCTIHTTINGQVKGFLKSNKNILRMAPSEKMSLLLYPAISLMEKIYIINTHHFITVSKKFSQQLKHYVKKEVVPIHNGIDISKFDYEKINDAFKLYPHLRDKKNIVLYAGRIISQKGIQLFAQLINDIDAHFVISGRGDKALLKNLLKNVSPKKYTYLGFVPHIKLPALYKLSKVFVLPSYYENFPFSLLEAMAMKCACVATDVGAVDEIIEDNVNGFIVPPGDYEFLKLRVKELIKDDKKRIEFADRGYRKVLSNFTSGIMAKKTYDFYRRIL